MPRLPVKQSRLSQGIAGVVQAEGQCGVYAIRNMRSGKVLICTTKYGFPMHYADQMAMLDSNSHFSQKHLQNAWKKYGRDCFRMWPLFECDMMDLDRKRGEFVRAFQSDDPKFGYNME